MLPLTTGLPPVTERKENSPLKIGLLTPAVTGYNALDSGIGQHFADLAVGLTELGHSVWAVTPEPKSGTLVEAHLSPAKFQPFGTKMPAWLDRLAGLRWQLHSVASLRYRMKAADRALAACVAREKLDLIETTSSGVLAGDYLRRSDRAVVVTRVSTTGAQLVQHNSGNARWPDRWEQQQEERLVRSSDGLITHTLNHRDELCRAWNLAPEAFAIIPHGIALPTVDQLVRPQKRGTVEVLFVGRFEHRKGIDVLLEAIPRIAAECPEVRFTLIGQDARGEYQARFRAQHPHLSAERVNFAGQASAAQLQVAYRDCDILAAPSRYESFGLIYVEAMAWGKPVVACASGGTPEVVADSETGLLATPGRADELSDRILRLVRDEPMRIRLGQNARHRVERLFSRSSLAAASSAYYRTVLARVPRGSR